MFCWCIITVGVRIPSLYAAPSPGRPSPETANASSEVWRMILLKSCLRCGGDVDATYAEEARCVQCAHRPRLVFPGPRVARPAEAGTTPSLRPRGEAGGQGPVCPRCGSPETVALDKMAPEYNTCWRCRRCGHIFSPARRARAR